LQGALERVAEHGDAWAGIAGAAGALPRLDATSRRA
jgi:hypothetical protein